MAHTPLTCFVAKDTVNVYLIGWVDYDPSFNFNRQSELDANRDNFVKGINATLTAQPQLDPRRLPGARIQRGNR
jgi:hypothetical protein